MTNQPPYIHGIFPTPVYIAKRDSDSISEEEKVELEKIIQQGLFTNIGNSSSRNTYIFDSNLKNIKQFCEQQLKIYVEEVINPKEELDFYITQSWLNIVKPGEFHHDHSHNNSLISGVFYLSTEKDDNITFEDMNFKIKQQINIEPKEWNVSNAVTWTFPAIINELILFPSWLNHRVLENEKATTDRISISFNTFVKGTLGIQDNLNELVLK